MDEKDRIKKAIEVAVRFGGTDGGHHKSWIIDQMVRCLTGCLEGEESAEYRKVVAEACDGEDGPETYDWDVGVPP